MNGKPKSSGAAAKIVSHCTHPELDGTDKMLLVYLVLNGDFITGANCHPGNRNLADALSLTDSPTDNRVRKNIARGLIERTERADGRGKASVYRICWDSPYFPDQTPGGERLIQESPCVDRADDKPHKPPCTDRADVSGTALPEGSNRPAGNPKPPCADAETALPRQAATLDPPETHHLPTTTQIGGGSSLEEKNLATIGRYGKRITELEVLIAEHGYDDVDKALTAIVKEGFEGVTSKVGVTLHRLPERIAELKAKHKAATDYAANEKRQEDFIEAQIQIEQISNCFRANYGAPFLTDEDRAVAERWKDSSKVTESEIQEFQKLGRERRKYLVGACDSAVKAAGLNSAARAKEEAEEFGCVNPEDWLN